METFIKVYIKSEEDLPKENNSLAYLVHLRTIDRFDICIYNNNSIYHGYHSNVWIDMYDWYLKPVEIPEISDEEIEKQITECGLSKVPEGQQFWQGAKWYRNELKKRLK